MRRVEPIALVIALVVVLGLLPTSWVRPITRDLYSILWTPLSPLSHGATAVRVWLRPGVGMPTDADRAVAEDRDRFRALWYAERLKVEGLENRLAQFQSIAASDRSGTDVRLEPADVLSRTPAAGGLALKVNVGRRQGVAAGDVAVIGGDGLVGRVSSEVGELGCFITTLTSKATPRFDARIIPASEERSSNPTAFRVQLSPDGSGALVGDIDLPTQVGVGDSVRLSDGSWPASAQGMLVGTVFEVRRKEAQPLRGEVTVRPRIDAATLGSVVVKLSVVGSR